MSKTQEVNIMSNCINRKVLIDLHIPELPPEALSKFSAKDVVKMVRDAGGRGLYFYANDHYGNSYYDTTIGHKHCHAKGDMFGDICAEAKKVGLTVFAYYSVCWALYYVKENPEWLQRDIKGQTVTGKQREFSTYLCLNSSYKHEIVLPQLEEIARKYNPASFFIDIVFIPPSACFCESCHRQYERVFGEEIPEDDKERLKFSWWTIEEFNKEMRDLFRKINPEIEFTINGAGMADMPESVHEPLTFLTCEAHPLVRGNSPYTQTWYAKYLQIHDKPADIFTVRFPSDCVSWEMKPLIQIKHEFADINVHGALINCGDHFYPDGSLEPAFYKVLKEAFAFIEEREEWCLSAKSVPEVAVLCTEWGDSLFGVCHILQEKHWHFDFISENRINRLARYKVLICPDCLSLEDRTIEAIREFVANGGNLILSYLCLDKSGKFSLSDILGLEFIGVGNFEECYIEPLKELMGNWNGLPILCKTDFVKAKPLEEVDILSNLRYPRIKSTFERNISHQHAPPGERSLYPAVSMHSYKKGLAAYIAPQFFKGFWEKQYGQLKEVFHNLMCLMLPDRYVEVKGPSSLQINVMRQQDRVVIHLLNFQINRPTSGKETLVVEEIPTIKGIEVSVSKNLIVPKKVYMAPDKKELEYKLQGNRLNFLVHEVNIHTMVVLEH